MKYKGIIFDLDGVLCSTDRFHYQAWLQTAQEVQASFDEQVNHRLRGVSRMESLEIILESSPLALSREAKERLAEEKNERYRCLLRQMTPADMPDNVRETLGKLRAASLRLGVGSSSKNARFILDRLNGAQYFDAVCDGTQITRSKPDPEVFLKAAGMLGLEPSECLVVEDAAAGLEAAHAAGMDCAGVGNTRWPFSPTYCLANVTALPAALGI